ncbi:MAG: radical SAM protein [Candidatus Omnitrophota bacterium]
MIRAILNSFLRSYVIKVKKALNLAIKPRFLNFAVTYLCNSHCTMCNIWKYYKINRGDFDKELSSDEIKRFFTENRHFLSGLRHIGLSGGEAFLRRDLVEIVRIIREEAPKAKLGIQTNGLAFPLIQKRLSEIFSFYPQISLAVSLDGTELTHNTVRGDSNSFKNAIDTVNFAKDLGVKSITMGMTITKENCREIEETKKIVEDLGGEFSCFFPDKSYYFNNEDEDYLFDTQMKDIVIEKLKLFPYHYFMDNLRRKLEGGNWRRRIPCYSGYSSIAIDPYGFVRACILRPEIFGNIRGMKLKDILYSKESLRIKQDLKKCTCWSQCEVSTSAIMDCIDVARWFVFACKDKKGFLQKTMQRWA